jgi:cytochrome c oxidase subunit II
MSVTDESIPPREAGDATAPASGGGDPLAAMYIVAALLMGLAAVVVVVLMFVPADAFDGRNASDVWVPGSTPPMVAANQFDAPGLTEVAPGRWLAVMEAYNWGFTPNEIRIPRGAELTIRARSRQDFHGIAVIGTPISISLEQNVARDVVHTFDTPGEYMFVCAEYCGSGHVGMMGTITVE